MINAHHIAVELPAVRRYARAITGSQQRGDAAVKQMLDAVLKQEVEIIDDKPMRRQLFQALHGSSLFNSVSHNSAAYRALTKRQQQLMLLTLVEGFSLADCACILGAPADILGPELDVATRTLQDGLCSRVLVIEDEGIIAQHIQMIVSDAGHEVVGVARTHAEAVDLALSTRPDVVLADINLGDGSNGINAVSEILDVMPTTVVFVTAFPDRLLTGEKTEPTFLVAKPFDPLVLTATIAQAIMTERDTVSAVH